MLEGLGYARLICSEADSVQHGIDPDMDDDVNSEDGQGEMAIPDLGQLIKEVVDQEEGLMEH